MSEGTPIDPKGPMIFDGVLYGMNAQVALWVQERLGNGLVEVPFQAFGIMPMELAGDIPDPSKPLDLAAGALFFNHYKGYDIECSVAVADIRSGHPRVIRKVLEYPFGDKPHQLNVPRITALIDARNTQSRDSAIKLGFELEGTRRGTSFEMWGLLRSECWVWNSVKGD